MRRAWRALGGALGLCLALLAAEGRAGARAEAPAQSRRFGDWTLLRAGAGRCLLHYRALERNSKLVLGDIFLLPAAGGEGGGGAVLSLKVPVGAALSTPAFYRHPEREAVVPLEWQSCDTAQCLAQVRITAPELARLRAGAWIEISFTPVPGAPRLSYPVSLFGITAGLLAVEQCQP